MLPPIPLPSSDLELVVGHGDGALVHVGHQGLQHVHVNIIEDEHRVTAGVVLRLPVQVIIKKCYFYPGLLIRIRIHFPSWIRIQIQEG